MRRLQPELLAKLTRRLGLVGLATLGIVLATTPVEGQICLEEVSRQVDCVPDSDGDFTLTLSLLNHEDTPFAIDRVFLWADPDAAYSVTPNSFVFDTPVIPGEKLE